jgi:acyl-CoA synthetase (AMP-forming)/AMP-acid ligase II
MIPRSLEAVFTDPATRAARAALSRRWQEEGYHRGQTVAQRAQWAAVHHGDTQLVFDANGRTETLTLSGLWDRARRVGGALRERGIGPDDTVAVQLPNCPQAAISYVATSITGAVVVPIVHTYGVTETDWILERTRPSAFIALGGWGGKNYAARLPAMPAVSAVATVVVVNDASRLAMSEWDDLERGPQADPLDIDPDAPFMATFTSGTTSEPKGVMHSHNGFLAELTAMPSPPRGDHAITNLQPWPAGHMGGMMAILGPLVHGYDTILLDRWDTQRAIELILEHRVEAASGVPTILMRLLDEVDTQDVCLPLREISCGGAGVPPSLIERAARSGWHVGRCYGSTEHPSVSYVPPEASRDHRYHSDGVALPGNTIRIVRCDGTPCVTGEDGEILVIGPEQCLGYTDPTLNAEYFTPDGWFRTGDVGYLDAEGFLTVTDRIKDLIIRGGENISSVEVESLLLSHPAVAEAAVVGLRDDVYGERVCAVVRLHPTSMLTLDAVRAYFAVCGTARLKTPERLEIVAEYPRTPTGKIQKRALRDLVEQGALDAWRCPRVTPSPDDRSDEIAIRALLAEYSTLVDRGEFVRLDEIFASDGTFVLAGETHHGLAAITALLEEIQSADRRGKHVMTTPVVDLDGECATAETAVEFYLRRGGGWQLSVTGRYRDHVVRTVGGWRVRLRDFVADQDRPPTRTPKET